MDPEVYFGMEEFESRFFGCIVEASCCVRLQLFIVVDINQTATGVLN